MFYPESVAVIGASRERGTIGNIVMENLVSGEYACCANPVNPNADEILGRTAYDSVLDVEGDVDLAVVAVPARIVPTVLGECAEKGAAGAAVISAGFSEVGERDLSDQVKRIAEESGLRVLGPNVLGLINTEIGLNASFASAMPRRGDVAFLTQSGALGGALIHWTAREGLGLSHVVSLGNKLDVDDADLVRYFDSKEEVDVVAIYMEGLRDGREFMDAARETGTPVVAVKVGRGEAGERATASHTGALAGQDRVFDAAFRQSGVIRGRTTVELFDAAEALTLQQPANGDRVAIVTNGGGAGVMAADACESHGLAVPELSTELREEVAQVLSGIASPCNPVDTLGDAGYERYKGTVRALAEGGEVDVVIGIHVETSQIDPMGAAKAMAEEAGRNGIPVVSCWVGGKGLDEALDLMRGRGGTSLSGAGARRLRRPRTRGTGRGRAGGGAMKLGEEETRNLAREYGIPLPRHGLAATREEAAELADDAGYPVVLKLVSPDLPHRTEAGAVRTDVETRDGALETYDDLVEVAERKVVSVEGVQVQEQVPEGREVIVGSLRDQTFGPTVMFGLGGIFVEVLEDVAFRVAPIDVDEARAMMRETRAYPVLEEFRGKPAADVVAAASRLMRENPGVETLDINPLVVHREGAVAVDIRIAVEE